MFKFASTHVYAGESVEEVHEEELDAGLDGLVEEAVGGGGGAGGALFGDDDDDEDACIEPVPAVKPEAKAGGLLSSLSSMFGGRRQAKMAAPRSRGGRRDGRRGRARSSRASRRDEAAAVPAMLPRRLAGGRRRPRPRPVRPRPDRPAFRRAVDTNVLSLDLSKLSDDAELATGDAVFCRKCEAALSSVSTVVDRDGNVFGGSGLKEAEAAGDAAAAEEEERETETEEAVPAPSDASDGKASEGKESKEDGEEDSEEPDDWTHKWVCEFCGAANWLELDDEEIPTVAMLDYLLEAAPLSDSAGGAAGEDSDSLVIFCVDVSGSMCCTSEVAGKVALRGGHDDALAELAAAHGAAGDQWRGGRRDVTYVSRLQAVQAAVEAQLAALKEAFPKKRAVLVTFSREVTVWGDGKSEPRIIAGDRLTDHEALLVIGKETEMDSPISDSYDALTKKLFELEEGGPTALGPAVVLSVAMASCAPGSKVIVCTDGVANVGLGSLDELHSDADRDAAAAFYSNLGAYAAEEGVVIDVIGIKGDGCDLENLGSMADASGGSVDLVDPLELTKNFTGIMADPVIATNVSATLQLHAGLVFRNEPGHDGSARLSKPVGNVTAATEITFEYALRSAAELKALGASKLRSLPFQVQVHYKRMDGSRCVRIITHRKPVTRAREVAEAEMDVALLGAHVAQQCAALAREGDYDDARKNAYAWSHVMKRGVREGEARGGKAAGKRHVLSKVMGKLASFDDALDEVLMEERMDVDISALADAAAAPAPVPAAAAAAAAPRSSLFSFGSSASSSKLKRARRAKRSGRDDLSSALYMQSKMNSADFM
eukprot:PLAT5019.2.p1 GENE.PLAT5019.2~~PLAT5019.2.p1  ORF type:complete len:827 (+),score=465.90 PLAT5019.2:277-2757(+)